MSALGAITGSTSTFDAGAQIDGGAQSCLLYLGQDAQTFIFYDLASSQTIQAHSSGIVIALRSGRKASCSH